MIAKVDATEEFINYFRSLFIFEHHIEERDKTIKATAWWMMHDVNIKLGRLRTWVDILNKNDDQYYFAMFMICSILYNLGNAIWIRKILSDVPKEQLEIVNRTCGIIDVLYEYGIIDNKADHDNLIDSDELLKGHKWNQTNIPLHKLK